jgi:hypothetical protein
MAWHRVNPLTALLQNTFAYWLLQKTLSFSVCPPFIAIFFNVNDVSYEQSYKYHSLLYVETVQLHTVGCNLGSMHISYVGALWRWVMQ